MLRLLSVVVFVAAQALSAQARESRPAVVMRLEQLSPTGDVRFSKATWATRLSNGSVAVADRYDARVVLIDSSGRLLQEIARTGGGPGEVETPTWVGSCAGDSIYVMDDAKRRLQLFSPSGRYVRGFPVDAGSLGVSCGASGGVLLADFLENSPASRIVQLSAVDASGKASGRLGTVALQTADSMLMPRVRLAGAPDGAVFGSGAQPALTFADAGGKPARRVPVGVAGRKPTTAQIDDEVEFFSTMIKGTPAELDRMRRFMARYPVATTLPAYSAVFGDLATGFVWVQTSYPGTGTTVLERFDWTGARRGTVTLELDLRVFEVRNNILLAVERTTEAGEEAIVAVRLPASPN